MVHELQFRIQRMVCQHSDKAGHGELKLSMIMGLPMHIQLSLLI